MKWFANIILLGLIPVYGVLGQVSENSPAQQAGLRQASSDTVLTSLSVEELMEFQNSYLSQADSLLEEKNTIRGTAIRDLEAFQRNYPNSTILDKILLRLGELYYDQAVYDFGKKVDRLSEGDADITSFDGPEPTFEYSKARVSYKKLVDAFPESPLVPNAIYNQAFLYEDSGDRESAFEMFQGLVNAYPESRFVPDALMRMAEYYFNPPVRELQKAIDLYVKLLEYRDSPRYDAALYRLGWAYYIQNDYPRAIAYFTLLIDDIDQVSEIDPGRRHHFPAVRDEAVEYIGISFLDFGGPQSAVDYFSQIGGREYGFDVLKKLGDAYMDVKEEYAKAADAYQLIINTYPDSPEAPMIQARIAEASRSLEDEDLVYSRRTELFQKYREGSEWWDNTEDESVKLQASNLAERALRENIGQLLKRAEESKDNTLYLKAVSDARDYLATFPDDTNAVRIHWNMALTLDLKLKMQQEAYKEYLEISNLYWGSEFQKQAAANAVAIVDQVLRADSTSSLAMQEVSVKRNSLGEIENSRPLSKDESRLAFALNNYVKLFPHEPETAEILSKSGGLYYERKQFKEAIKFFKTLIRHYPDSEQASNARYLTMESYFGKGDYESTEILAKQVKGLAPEYADKANKRLGESIFLKAQALAEASNYASAGEEYLRIVSETPSVEFADQALFNAGLQYEKIQNYNRAIQIYNQLLANYPESEHTLDALNNLAFDQRETKDYYNAAATYERLYKKEPDGDKSRVALYNASVSYVHAEEWLRSINVNNQFVEQFPNSEEADDLLFNNANYYLKLNDLSNANSIYAKFTQKFSDSPRVVEAYYKTGDYYYRNNQIEDATKQFRQAIEKNKAFTELGKEANDFFACEALFHLTEIKYAQFRDIQFRGPAKESDASKEKKKKLLQELVDNYTKIAAYGTYRVYEATYRIGGAYEEFAKTWSEQDIMTSDNTKRIMARKEINTTAAELYEKAVDAFKAGTTALERLTNMPAKQPSDTLSTTLSELSLEDSTRVSAARWVAKCRDKVSENLFVIADIQRSALNALLVAPKPAGLSELEQIVYDQQVMLKAISPLIDRIVKAHSRNLEESQLLGLDNKWTQNSRTEILRISSLSTDKFSQLSESALLSFKAKLRQFDRLSDADDETAYDVGDRLSAFLELSATLTQQASDGYKKQIVSLRETDDGGALSAPTVEENFIQKAYSFGSTADSLATYLNARRQYYNNKFKETDNPTFEDAYFTFDDILFSLGDKSNAILKFAFDASQELKIANKWSRKLVQLVLKKNPEEYAEQLGLQIKTAVVKSSSDWLVSLAPVAGWTEANHSDTLWNQAMSEGPASTLSDAGAEVVWFSQILDPNKETGNILPAAATENKEAAIQFVRSQTIFLRKAFLLNGTPVSGVIGLNVDDSYRLYLNGMLVAENKISADQKESVQNHDLQEYLQEGMNLIAVEAMDTDKSGGGFAAVLELRYLETSTELKQN